MMGRCYRSIMPVSTDHRPADRARRRRTSELVAEDLLDAALVEFAAHGFDGASTRAIAARAGWHQPQINYHFASKVALWRAAVDRLFSLLGAAVDADALDLDDPVEAFRAGVRRFVRFSADHPELFRIMNLESTCDSDRLDWLVDRHIRDRFALVEAAWGAVRAAGAGADLPVADVYQLLIGHGALVFANAPCLRRFAGIDPAADGFVDAHAERLLAILLPPGPSAPTRSRR